MKKTIFQILKIKTKFFFRSLSLSRANKANLSEGRKAKYLRKLASNFMSEGVVDPNMGTFR
jgi:hypothetical protein